jgi:hypothetical protein
MPCDGAIIFRDAAVYVELTMTRQAALQLEPLASGRRHSDNRQSATQYSKDGCPQVIASSQKTA